MASANSAVLVAPPASGQGYQVVVHSGGLAIIGEQIKTLFPKAQQVLVVTETSIARYYGASLNASLTAEGLQVHMTSLSGGESCKSIAQAQALYDVCLTNQLTRHDVVLALGGGVMGDLAGYVAATYRRGVGFVQCPTSLLAQVDASVGGKVAVNYGAFKNMIGVFYQPQLVLIDPETLKTLPERDFACGMAEVIKYALLQQCIPQGDTLPDLMAVLMETASLGPENMEAVITLCCQLKAWVVEADPEEKLGVREFLNLGHTFAHAYETLSNGEIPHGEAVAIGLNDATRLAVKQGFIPATTLGLVRALCEKFKLPTAPNQVFDVAALVAAMMQDKKRQQQSTIRFILPSGVLGTVKAVELSPEVVTESFRP